MTMTNGFLNNYIRCVSSEPKKHSVPTLRESRQFIRFLNTFGHHIGFALSKFEILMPDSDLQIQKTLIHQVS